jgi:signal transduction histidine kinase
MRTLALFVILGVLAPTGVVLWFMNDAARSQAEASRQSLSAAYRGQMRLLSERVDEMWRGRAERLETIRYFPSVMMMFGADSAVFLDESGAVVYPAPAVTVAADRLAERRDWSSAESIERDRPLEAAAAYERIERSETDASIAAQAAQARIRCLVRAGKKDAARAAIERSFTTGRTARGRDALGRWIAADEQLLGVTVAERDERLRRPFVERLAGWLNDYKNVDLPSAQRVFLMQSLMEAAPELEPFRTYEAERLALEFAPMARSRPGSALLEASGLPGIWKLASPNARVIALYKEDSVARATMAVLGPPRNVRVFVSPVGRPAGMDPIPAGATMPGWQLSYASVNGQPLDFGTRRRHVTYLWIGYAVVATMGLTGIVVAGSFARQLRLARLKTDMVAAVSHELKTPLASMRLLVDSLLEDGAEDAKKTREYLELISGENARLTRLIENFLAFSRIERGQQRFEFTPVEPGRLVEATLAAVRERLPGAAETIEVDVAAGLPPIHADADAVVTVLLNLIDNAYKYTPGEKRIALRAVAEGQGVAYLVQDNGIGIAAAEQKKIFRRFYRVDRRLARTTSGCGLGLSIVDSIVRAHGGDVSVKSVEGDGSTFRVWLPREGRG